ncbi:hypothetical protein INT44_006135 [Umbelopsis vinacea]|uniref:Sm domain-containing protein n=1 Tax=Umbelopsis vinacea TaxID=44442 RepID=A0A8H7PSW7_9FUNG|nr:hypothetical protein INT44_006135 [Umbelopsis vinacea]
MSDRGARGSSRGSGDRGRGGSGRGGRGGGRGGSQAGQEKPKKESILDLSKYQDKEIRVKFSGGREGERATNASFSHLNPKQLLIYLFSVVGTLKGYDPLLNLVLDNTTEHIKDLETDQYTSQKRTLGLSVLRGTAIILISPVDGSEEIENPFLAE